MKFSVQSVELQRALSKAASVVPTRSPISALENILFELKEDTLLLTASDNEVSLTLSLPVKGMENGTIAIPAKKIIDTVRSLPDVQIMFTIDTVLFKVKMSTVTGEYQLPGISSEEFPPKPDFKGEHETQIEPALLRRMIEKTSFAVSPDELRLSMTGVLFQIREQELRTVATDGHRLVRAINSSFRSPKFQKDIIIPSKALNIVAKLTEGEMGLLQVNDNHILFQFETATIISRLIIERYPNYETVIPLDNDKKLIVGKDHLLSTVRRVSLYSNAGTHQIRLSMQGGELTVAGEDIDFGSEAKETMPCSFSAEPMEIGFNSNYIIDVLAHVEGDEVELSFNSPGRAGIVMPRKQHENEDILMLVMPVRLNG